MVDSPQHDSRYFLVSNGMGFSLPSFSHQQLQRSGGIHEAQSVNVANWSSTTMPTAPENSYSEKAGSYYCWNRIYDPGTGRWTTPDPATSPWTNLYSYSSSLPILGTDPSGLSDLGMEAIEKYLEWKKKWQENRGVDKGKWQKVENPGAIDIHRAEDCNRCGKACTYTFTTTMKLGTYVLGGKTIHGVFIDIGFSNRGDCCDCKEIKFYQAAADTKNGVIVKPTGTLEDGLENDGWYSDIDISRDEIGGKGAYPSHSQYHDNDRHRLLDAPGWEDGLHLNSGKKFHTCAVCEKKDGTKIVLACLKWGFSVDGNGKVSAEVEGTNCGATDEFKKAMDGYDSWARSMRSMGTPARSHGITFD